MFEVVVQAGRLHRARTTCYYRQFERGGGYGGLGYYEPVVQTVGSWSKPFRPLNQLLTIKIGPV